tara:strand:+ start:1312 stop:2070 length:759 start_codon:yes stop_codon:yes gene_type:complete
MKIKNLLNYKNKKVVITGCNGQLGKFMCKLFIDLGCKVYGIDKTNNKFLKSTKFVFNKVDISKKINIENFLGKVLKKEKVDIFINNAGYSPVTHFSKRTQEETNETFDTNLISIINIINTINKLHNIKNKCKIINIGSVYGVRSPDFQIYKKEDRINSEVYGASKAGLIQITKYFAVALAKRNIIINCISPGGIQNNNLQNKNFVKNYNKKVPIGRMGKPDDLTMALIYFSNDLTTYTTGQNLIVDGGFTLC